MLYSLHDVLDTLAGVTILFLCLAVSSRNILDSSVSTISLPETVMKLIRLILIYITLFDNGTVDVKPEKMYE